MTRGRLHLLLAVCLTIAVWTNPTCAQNQSAKVGYEVAPYWIGLTANPTAVTFDDQGHCFCLGMSGQIWVGSDTDGDDMIDQALLIFDGDSDPNYAFPFTGLTWHAGALYLSSRGKITRLEDTNGDDVIDLETTLVAGLPTSEHQNNAICFDENDNLLFALGSLTDHGPEPFVESATIMMIPAGGGPATIWATGVRNAYGIAYKPGFGLVAVDNAPNYILDNLDPPDELNIVQQGLDYGYPGIYGMPPAGSGTESPALLFAPHAAPCAFDFNPDAFSGWGSDVYVPLLVAPGGIVVRCSLHILPSGEERAFMEPFAWGFQNPIDARFAPDGALIVADHTAFSLYRVAAEEEARIRVTNPPVLGNALTVEISDPNEPLDFYGFFMSTSDSPAWDLGNGHKLNLNVNTPLFQYTFTPGNAINQFTFPGQLDVNGKAQGTVYLPFYPPLLGLKMHMAWVSWDAAGNIGAESAPLTMVVMTP